MQEERGFDCNNGPVGGLFNGCNSEILFFIIVFLLLFTNCGCNRR